MGHVLPSRRFIIEQLDATIAEAQHRVRWRRLVLRAMAVLGRDTPTAKALLLRAERRLTSLQGDRRHLFGVGIR